MGISKQTIRDLTLDQKGVTRVGTISNTTHYFAGCCTLAKQLVIQELFELTFQMPKPGIYLPRYLESIDLWRMKVKS